MARKSTPSTPDGKLALGGKTFRVSYDFNALALMHEITGVNLLHGWEAAKFGPKEVVAFVFAGLQRYQPEVEYKWIAEQLHLGNYDIVLAQLKDALKRAMPEPKQGEAPAEGNA